MPSFPRYAIYFVPPADSALYRFGGEMLGYDAYSGEALPQPPSMLDAFPDWASLTQEPRTYGFHATFKAPFALNGAAEAALHAAFERFASSPRAIPSLRPTVKALGRFIAIVPDDANAQLSALANECVMEFDAFRAPLTPDDRERRLKSPLTPHQIELLDRWGYPYVFEEFRFHMTLTGNVPDDRRAGVLAHLRAQFALLNLSQIAIDTIGLFRQDDKGGSFRIERTAALTAK